MGLVEVIDSKTGNRNTESTEITQKTQKKDNTKADVLGINAEKYSIYLQYFFCVFCVVSEFLSF